MMCGGLNGCPRRVRSGCLQPDCITLIVMLDELDAMMESGGVAASISANSLILNSGRSGAFSYTKAAFDKTTLRVDAKEGGSGEAPCERPIVVSDCPASATYVRSFASAFGAGSVAT